MLKSTQTAILTPHSSVANLLSLIAPYSITETNATLYAKFALQQIDSAGFYIGQSTSSLKKISKNLEGKPDGAGKFNTITYPLNNWYGKLTPNTT